MTANSKTYRLSKFDPSVTEIVTPEMLGIAAERWNDLNIEAALVKARFRNEDGSIGYHQDRIIPVAFYKKSEKERINSGYCNNREFAIDYLRRHISEYVAQEDKKIKDRDDMLQEFQNIKVNDIYCVSFGYEQTVVIYYQVVEKKGKSTLVFRQVESAKVANGDQYTGQSTPIPDAFCDDALHTVRITSHGMSINGYPLNKLSYREIMNGAVRIYETREYTSYH